MHIVSVDDYEAMSRAAADLVCAVIANNPAAVMVLATGNTPMGLYRDVAQRRQRGEIDTSRLRIFQLDAYLGLAPDDPRSLYGWLRRSVLDPWGVPETNVVRLRGDAVDPEAECRAYDESVVAVQGFDLSVLGLGPNGHLGFNEPPVDPGAPTRIVDLTPESVESSARYWGGRDQVPPRALTAGMHALLAARQTLLVVSGAHKQEILRRTVAGPVTPDVPASLLQQASNVTVIADRAAWPPDVADSTGYAAEG
ncbi:MAG TPA: glucosamine-6-phosphate deaminase [Herpetosiphonaceae bacterium]|nr:glucosamine-6-phosphate deaminase [Herpetosiphonaceae bacterium]